MRAAYRFDRFLLDPDNRRLTEDGRTVDLSGRYLDALVLLVSEQGRLVTKARFLDEVWKGAPVTDEALTQCVRALRMRLGDQAGRPRFIETAPGHGYRFIAPVTVIEVDASPPSPLSQAPTSDDVGTGPPRAPAPAVERFAAMGRAGLIGGGAAGLVGGVAYGFAGVANAAGGAASGLLVLAALTAAVGMIGGAAVGLGVGATAWLGRQPGPWSVLGGACGGLGVGAVVRLAGLDAFSLLFGAAPAAMTGAGEGGLLGAAIGAGVWIAQGRRRRIAGPIRCRCTIGRWTMRDLFPTQFQVMPAWSSVSRGGGAVTNPERFPSGCDAAQRCSNPRVAQDVTRLYSGLVHM